MGVHDAIGDRFSPDRKVDIDFAERIGDEMGIGRRIRAYFHRLTRERTTPTGERDTCGRGIADGDRRRMLP